MKREHHKTKPCPGCGKPIDIRYNVCRVCYNPRSKTPIKVTRNRSSGKIANDVPRFDANAGRWRGWKGYFMRRWEPLAGWVIARCDRCGLEFPTKAWRRDQRPKEFFCTESCWKGHNA